MAPNPYATVQLIKLSMPDSQLDTVPDYDQAITRLVLVASRAVDGFFGRRPGAFYADSDETRYYDGVRGLELWVDELAAPPTSVSVSETGSLTSYTALQSSDYILWPDNAPLDGIPYTRIDLDLISGTRTYWPRFRRAVKVVGKFGFSATVPYEIEQMTVIQTVRWFKRGQQGFQDVGAIQELGQLRYVKQLDPDIAALFDVQKFHRVTV